MHTNISFMQDVRGEKSKEEKRKKNGGDTQTSVFRVSIKFKLLHHGAHY